MPSARWPRPHAGSRRGCRVTIRGPPRAPGSRRRCTRARHRAGAARAEGREPARAPPSPPARVRRDVRPLAGETEDEYRARIVPLIKTGLAIPRAHVEDMRKQAEAAAHVTRRPIEEARCDVRQGLRQRPRLHEQGDRRRRAVTVRAQRLGLARVRRRPRHDARRRQRPDRPGAVARSDEGARPIAASNGASTSASKRRGNSSTHRRRRSRRFATQIRNVDVDVDMNMNVNATLDLDVDVTRSSS